VVFGYGVELLVGCGIDSVYMRSSLKFSGAPEMLVTSNCNRLEIQMLNMRHRLGMASDM